jgi:two-component system CheB/CheR fusion protein
MAACRSACCVLVVDDQVDTVRTTVELFRDRDLDPDAVVMDIAMPGITGWDAARTIGEDFPGKRPLLIAITGQYKGAADLILTKLSGFDHYFLKPPEPAKLIELVGSAP